MILRRGFTFVATQDSEDDDGESVVLGFGNLIGGIRPGALATTTIEIADDDAPESVEVSFESDTYTVMEGSTVMRVTLSADPEREVVIPITRTEQGGATSTDYSGVPDSVTFNSGEVSKTVVFAATQDSDDDDDESVRLTFGTLPPMVFNGATTTATVSITDDDSAGVTVTPTTLTIEEGATSAYTVVTGLRANRDHHGHGQRPVQHRRHGGPGVADLHD